MKKRWIAFCLMLVLALVTLVGCGGSAGTIAPETGQSKTSDVVWLESAPESTDDEVWQPSPINPDTTESTAQGSTEGSSGAGADSTAQGSTEESSGTGANSTAQGSTEKPSGGKSEDKLDENGSYSSKDDVALYLHLYGRLPKNFITKKEAKKLGWSGGSVEKYAPGKAIGGDYFGNYEGLLPDGNYHECDIDTIGKKSRGAKRIIYSDDGRIYYTDDHYESFTLLYGEE